MTRAIALLLLALPVASGATTPTLCQAGEIRYFDCVVGATHKVASLCGQDTEPRWLQYRFGLVGHAPELQVPPTPDDLAMGTTFFYDGEHTRDGDVESISIWFRHADVIYSIGHVRQHSERPPEFANITLWQLPMRWPPRTLSCASPVGARTLAQAYPVIWSMSPPGRLWYLAPRDDERRRAGAAAASAASPARP